MQIQLWNGCKDGKVEEVQKLLQNSQINLNWQNQNKYLTPFYIACEKGHLEIVKLLLNDSRVDITKADDHDYTPFYIACQEGHTNIVELLLNDKRVDINKVSRESDGLTPFSVACYEGHIEIVKLLLNERKIDINEKDIRGFTGLDWAKHKGKTDIVKLIESFQEICNFFSIVFLI